MERVATASSFPSGPPGPSRSPFQPLGREGLIRLTDKADKGMVLGFSVLSTVFQFVISTYLLDTGSRLEKLSQTSSILEKELCKILNRKRRGFITSQHVTQSGVSRETQVKHIPPVLVSDSFKMTPRII